MRVSESQNIYPPRSPTYGLGQPDLQTRQQGSHVVERYEFSSLSQLLELVMDHRDAANSPLWFRGHSSEEYKLIPKIMRGDERPMAEVYRREARLLARFRERSLPFWPAGYPQGAWEHLFSMQHHGVPTRLLDWSENLFVAAYFAALPANSDPSARPTIWTLDPIGWNSHIPQLADSGVGILTVADEEQNRWEPVLDAARILAKRAKHPVALYGIHNSARIVAQRGTFTITGDQWCSMDDMPSSDLPWQTYLKKYVYVGDREKIQMELTYLGFTNSMIFPDLENLSRELEALEGWS